MNKWMITGGTFMDWKPPYNIATREDRIEQLETWIFFVETSSMPSWKHIHFFFLGVLLKKQVKPICRPDISFATLGG
jgi:hypothetical protein